MRFLIKFSLFVLVVFGFMDAFAQVPNEDYRFQANFNCTRTVEANLYDYPVAPSTYDKIQVLWDFGDGTTQLVVVPNGPGDYEALMGATVEHTYSSFGPHCISVTILVDLSVGSQFWSALWADPGSVSCDLNYCGNSVCETHELFPAWELDPAFSLSSSDVCIGGTVDVIFEGSTLYLPPDCNLLEYYIAITDVVTGDIVFTDQLQVCPNTGDIIFNYSFEKCGKYKVDLFQMYKGASPGDCNVSSTQLITVHCEDECSCCDAIQNISIRFDDLEYCVGDTVSITYVGNNIALNPGCDDVNVWVDVSIDGDSPVSLIPVSANYCPTPGSQLPIPSSFIFRECADYVFTIYTRCKSKGCQVEYSISPVLDCHCGNSDMCCQSIDNQYASQESQYYLGESPEFIFNGNTSGLPTGCADMNITFSYTLDGVGPYFLIDASDGYCPVQGQAIPYDLFTPFAFDTPGYYTFFLTMACKPTTESCDPVTTTWGMDIPDSPFAECCDDLTAEFEFDQTEYTQGDTPVITFPGMTSSSTSCNSVYGTLSYSVDGGPSADIFNSITGFCNVSDFLFNLNGFSFRECGTYEFTLSTMCAEINPNGQDRIYCEIDTTISLDVECNSLLCCELLNPDFQILGPTGEIGDEVSFIYTGSEEYIDGFCGDVTFELIHQYNSTTQTIVGPSATCFEANEVLASNFEFQNCGDHIFTLIMTCLDAECSMSEPLTVTVPCPPIGPCCVDSIPVPYIGSNNLSQAGQFIIDENSGVILFSSYDCPSVYPINCFGSCAEEDEGLKKVISASAAIFSDQWRIETDDYFSYEKVYHGDLTANANDYERGFSNKWRSKKSYAYRSPHDIESFNYDRGRFTMVPFDWRNPSSVPEDDNSPDDYLSPNWVLTNHTTAYSPHGQPMEDKNIMNVYSSARYGYNHTEPIIVSQNAPRLSSSFESFENEYVIGSDSYFETGLPFNDNDSELSTSISHTGSNSLRLNPAYGGYIEVGEVILTPSTESDKIAMRYWLRVSNPEIDDPTDYHSVNFRMASSASWGPGLTRTLISSSGEWFLFEARYPSSLVGSEEIVLGIKPVEYLDENPGYTYIDDVRIQPTYAESVCYVYDDAHRLVASFDDQHFALLYQYNEQGALIRKLKETSQGIVTISETQYNAKGEVRQ